MTFLNRMTYCVNLRVPSYRNSVNFTIGRKGTCRAYFTTIILFSLVKFWSNITITITTKVSGVDVYDKWNKFIGSYTKF